MLAPATFRERLPSAVAAIALQAGLLALLLLSFQVVRHISEEKEHFITLPSLASSLPPPMIIDARGPRKARPIATPPPMMSDSVAPAMAAPPGPAAPAAPGNAAPAQANADCVPPGQARPAYRIACPLPPPPANAQANDLPLHPDSHVKDEAHWAEEKARRDGPLPGVSADEHSIHITLFDSNGPSLFGGYRAPQADVPHAHSSDVAFQDALAAIRARRAYASIPRPADAQKTPPP